ncbi:hypothetical protein CEP54_010181 [Fusarium duplospermum]|uniref:Uncharacterized protein n=1 Tax=Fusarium duplospermum TaxID=1325734 RepID=A0A428PLH9_9HYPO|nr:hypothetical protein CEP54_010181 [Fusarium duplospermum]
MWGFLDYALAFTIVFFSWLAFVKLPKKDKNRRSQKFKEELEEFMKQRSKVRTTRMMPEDEAGMRELLRRHPQYREFLGQWEEDGSPPGSPGPRLPNLKDIRDSHRRDIQGGPF